MPDHKTHRRFARVFGLDSSDIDRLMDEPYKILGGRHRILRHDPSFIIALLLDKGIDAGLKAWLHLILDEDKSLARLFKSLEGGKYD